MSVRKLLLFIFGMIFWFPAFIGGYQIKMIAIAIGFVLSFVALKGANHRNLSVTEGALIAFVGWASFSILRSTSAENFPSLIVEYFGIIFVYLVTAGVHRNRREWKYLGFSYVIGALLMSSIVILNYRLGNFADGSDGRFSVGEWNANYVAYSLATAMPVLMTVSWVDGRRDSRYRVLALSMASLLLGVAIFLTGSRGAVLAFILVVITVALRSFGSIRWRLVAPLIVVMTLTGAWIYQSLPQELTTRLSQYDAQDVDGFTSGRAIQWIIALQLVVDHPLIGNGIGAFAAGNDDEIQLHNVFLNVAVEHGIPALVVYLIVIASLLLRLFRANDSKAARWGGGYAVSYMVSNCSNGCMGLRFTCMVRIRVGGAHTSI